VYALFAFHAVHVLLESAQYAGYASGVAMVLIFFTANGLVRKRNYEFFYVAHIVLVAVILITGKHSSQVIPRAFIDAFFSWSTSS
jgi:hypothetical protein